MNKNVILALFALFFTTVATAEENKLTFDADTGVYGKYVWRGITFNDNVVNQGSVTASYAGFSANVWYNLDLTDEGDDNEFQTSEVDYTLSYSGQINDQIAYDAGYVYYDFPTANNGTGELFVGLSFDTILAPSVTLYYDIDEVNGFFLDFGISHGVELSEGYVLELGANLGLMDDDQSEFYLGKEGSNFSNITLSAALPIALNDTFTLTPAVYFNSLVTGGNAEAVGVSGSDEESVFASLSLSASF